MSDQELKALESIAESLATIAKFIETVGPAVERWANPPVWITGTSLGYPNS